MRIFDFETEDEIQNVEDNLNNIKIIRNNFADNVSAYRIFSASVELDFRTLSDCIALYERSLLINAYTYAEQLVKNFYYELLEKDRSLNEYTRNFVNRKLDPEKFSPNVKYGDIEKNIKTELCSNFKFIINKEKEEIKKYDDLIKNRHSYAHKGIYQADFEQYRDVINAEKYITSELVMIVEKGMDYRIEYQNKWEEIITKLKKCERLYNNYKENSHIEIKKKIIKELKILREFIKKFYVSFHEYINGSELLKNVSDEFLRIINIDLRRIDSLSIIDNLSAAIRECKIVYYKLN